MSNQGKRWSTEQDDWLLARMAEKKYTIPWAAKQMERSVGSIRARLCKLALDMMAATGNTAEEAAEATGISITVLEEFIELQESRKNKGSPSSEPDPTPASPIPKSNAPPPPPPPPLNAEQSATMAALAEGHNIFLTGPAGTGKSFTIQHITEWATQQNKICGVTALTGSAALLLGGRTLHSFIGLGVGSKTVAEMVAYTRYRLKPLVKRICDLDILIIDEISMMSAELFTKMIGYIAAIRKSASSPQPQYILCGDFYQLPPVSGAPCHTAPEWTALHFPLHTIELKTQMRQDGDKPFQEMLARLRLGACSPTDLTTLRAQTTIQFPDGIIPTRLYATNAVVDRVNAQYFKELLSDGRPQITYALQSKNAESKRWAESVGLPEAVTLAVGAQVIVTRNMCDMGLVNGSRAKVIQCNADAVVIQTVGGHTRTIPFIKIEAPPTQGTKPPAASLIPLKLAYALSIHKSQGMTLDAIEIDIGPGIFAPGQAYVAISRAKSLSSCRITNVSPASFMSPPSITK